MLNGTYGLPRVVEESVCRSSKDYRFTDIGVYKIHSNALMPDIPFDEATNKLSNIELSIFDNDKDSMIDLPLCIETQNYLTTKYIGRAPLEWYQGDKKTKKGRQFILLCRGGNPSVSFRVFGTEDAIRGYNMNANENISFPDGGE